MIDASIATNEPSLPGARLRRFVAGALGRASPLVLARLGSAVLTFGLPLLLARLLVPEAFGAYKQFFLVAQTVLLIGQLGLTQSLYYFLPRGGAERGSYVTHALGALALLGALFGGALYGLAPEVGRLVGAQLTTLRVPLALFAGGMLVAAPLEGALTSENRIVGAALTYVASDTVRAAALGGAAYLWGGHALFWAAAAFAWLRVATLAGLVTRGVLPSARPRKALLTRQLAFALPFAGSSWLYVGQRYFSQYAVSAHFDAATFALFTVASFHLPVVDIVFTPITEVMMVQLGRAGGDRAAALAHWDDAVEKLASILFPAACGAWLLGPTVLPLLFTHKYAGAVPLFLLATIEMPLAALPCDALLRAGGDTRFLFGFNAARVVITGACVIGGMHALGLPGAIVGGIASEAMARVAMLARGQRFLGARGLGLLDWGMLWRIAAAAAVAGLPVAALRLVMEPGAGYALASVALYGATYLTLRLRWGGHARAAVALA